LKEGENLLKKISFSKRKSLVLCDRRAKGKKKISHPRLQKKITLLKAWLKDVLMNSGGGGTRRGS